MFDALTLIRTMAAALLIQGLACLALFALAGANVEPSTQTHDLHAQRSFQRGVWLDAGPMARSDEGRRPPHELASRATPD